MSDSDPIDTFNGETLGRPGASGQDEKIQSPIKLRFKNVGKSNLSKAAHPTQDKDPNVKNEAPPPSINLESNDASPSAISVDEQNMVDEQSTVDEQNTVGVPNMVHSPKAQSLPSNSISRPPSPFHSSSSHPPTQLPSSSSIPLQPTISTCTPTPAPSSQPLDVSPGAQRETPLSASSQHPVPPSHPTPRRRPPVSDSGPSYSEQQRRIDILKANMPSQEEELARIRQNMAFLDSDPEPKMDNDLNVWAKRRFTDEERDNLRGIVQHNSLLAMAMDNKKSVGSSMHQGVYQPPVKTTNAGPLDEKKIEEAKARIQKALNKFRPSPADLAKLAQFNTHPESHGMSPRDSSLKAYSDIQNMPSKEFTPYRAANNPLKKPDVSDASAPLFTYPHRAASKASAGAPSELINPTRLRPGRGIDRDSGLTTEEAKLKEKVAGALAEYDDDYEENLEEMERYLAVLERKR